VIHIATVHFQSDKWINIQLRYLKKHVREPFRIYACTPAPAEKYSELYYFCSDYEPLDRRGVRSLILNKLPISTKKSRVLQRNTHVLKLTYLARRILRDAADSDLIIFLDGDAFPISDFVEFIREKIDSHKLVAIRRDENNGDIQPHPSFCATSVGFWKRIKGDWRAGYSWRNSHGQVVSDVGGNLLKQLQDVHCDWYPLLSCNRRSVHPIWFGIYGDIIYHHGAGFRAPVSRYDLPRGSMNEAEAVALYKSTPEYQATARLSEEMFHKIETNENFYLELITDTSTASGA